MVAAHISVKRSSQKYKQHQISPPFSRMKAMVFAAGLGTRMRPLTNDRPKALVQIGDYTLLEIVLRRLKQYNFTDVIVNTHYFADQIADYLAAHHNFGLRITLSDERDELLDTGGGLRKAASFFDDDKPFLVHNVDVLSNINLHSLYEHHLASGHLATLAVMERSSSRYFLFDDKDLLCGWKNTLNQKMLITRAHSGQLRPLAFSGIQVIHPALLRRSSKQGVFSLTDWYLDLAANHPIGAYRADGFVWADIGKPENIQLGVNMLGLLDMA